MFWFCSKQLYHVALLYICVCVCVCGVCSFSKSYLMRWECVRRTRRKWKIKSRQLWLSAHSNRKYRLTPVTRLLQEGANVRGKSLIKCLLISRLWSLHPPHSQNHSAHQRTPLKTIAQQESQFTAAPPQGGRQHAKRTSMLDLQHRLCHHRHLPGQSCLKKIMMKGRLW